MSAVPQSDGRVTTLDALRRPPAEQVPNVRVGFADSAGFELIQRVAKGFASSTLVPKEYVGNISNCLVALEMAQRIGASPLMVMQNLYVVHGRPAWSSKFLIASFNQCGRFSAIRFEWFGEKGKDDWGCRAWAIEKSTGERIEGPTITIALSKKEGWYEKSGSKWKTIPELMLMYRSAGWLVNTHAPEISMGLNTAEEIGDTFDATQDANGGYQVTTESLRADLGGGGTVIDADPVTTEPAKTNGQPVSLTDDVLGIIKAAGEIADEEVARLKLEDARALLAELLPENRKRAEAAIAEVEAKFAAARK
jgi:hypothetical protein